MRKLLTALLFSLSASCIFSQKVSVGIVLTEGSGITSWEILDEAYSSSACSNELAPDDTVYFSLPSGHRFFLDIRADGSAPDGKILANLIIDRESVLTVSSERGILRYTFPFFTGPGYKESKIIGGTNASISQYPWQVYVVAGNFLCGGSIIGSNWVVTAAHCVVQNGIVIAPFTVTVTAGSSTPASSGTRYNIARVVAHPGYNSSTYLNDIALLQTTVPIGCTNCTPIKLVNSYNVQEGFIDPGTIATITGWGLTDAAAQTIPSILQQAQVPIVSVLTASVVWPSIPSTDIMAGYRTALRDVCSGDSGGPLAVPVEGETKLAGITSWGSTNCDTYSGYTSVPDLESWIRSNTGIVDYTLAVPTGDSVVCPGTASSSYTAQVVSGTPSYEWKLFPSNAGTVTWSSQNATVVWNPQFTGALTVKVRVLVNGAYSEWGRRSVTKGVTTVIQRQTPDTVICQAQHIILKAETTGTNLKFTWYKNDTLYLSGPVNNIDYPSAQPSNSGIYKCQITGLCGSPAINPVHLTVHPLTFIHEITPDILADYGTDTTIRVTATGHNLSFSWTKNSTVMNNRDHDTLHLKNMNARNIGLYRSVVAGTCGILTSSPVYLYLNRNKIPAQQDFTVWPTVTSGEINVAAGSDEPYDVSIFDSSGRLLFSSLNCRYQTTINVSHYRKGIYIFRLEGKGFNRPVKFVKK